ncbi:MAG: SDR family NAD(P)-dependent oxidoreductase [Mycobacteriales bacterium]
MALPTAAADRTCLVTGASSGIGADIARQLAGRGRGVTLVARREEPLRALAEELAVAGRGVRVEVVVADLGVPAERTRVLREVESRGLTVDVLVNNAGVGTSGPAAGAEVDRELAMVRLNVEAVVDLCTQVLPAMVERRRGAVLNVASTAAFQPLPGQAAYAATKAFVLSYSEAVRAELRGTGVTMAVLCPGPVETGFGAAAGISDQEAHALPSILWVSSRDVARAAVEGLERDRGVVIPGVANRVGAVGAHLAPRRLLLPVLARRHPSLHR